MRSQVLFVLALIIYEKNELAEENQVNIGLFLRKATRITTKNIDLTSK